MRKKIRIKIQKAQAESICEMQILPRARVRKDFIRRTLRDNMGNHLREDGDLVLSHVLTDSGETMTPSKQYRLSTLRRVVTKIPISDQISDVEEMF